MENVQAYIFIGIVVLIAIIKVIGEAKKNFSKEKRRKVAVRSQSYQTVQQNKGFEEWENWLSHQKEEKKHVSSTAVSSMENKPNASVSKPHQFLKPIQKESKTQAHKSPFGFRSKEEIRRAIIYSEIINRKY